MSKERGSRNKNKKIDLVPAVEVAAPSEPFENDGPPTMLPLFTFSQEKLEQLQFGELLLKQYVYEQFSPTIVEKRKKSNDKNEDLLKKINSQAIELSDQNDYLESSRAISIGYITVLNEFQAKGIPEEEAYAFFKRCIASHLRNFGRDFESRKVTGSDGYIRYLHMPAMPDETFRKKNAQIHTDAGKPPTWFDGVTKDWEVYYFNHAMLNVHFDRHKEDMFLLKYLPEGISKEQLPKIDFLFKEAIPDWLSEGILPTRESVEDELYEDAGEQEIIKIKVKKEMEKYQYVQDKYLEKWNLSEARQRRMLEEIKFQLDSSSLPDILLYSYYIQDIGKRTGGKAIAASRDNLQYIFSVFSEKITAYSVSLFIEYQQKIISQELAQANKSKGEFPYLDELISDSQKDLQEDYSLRPLRDTDKKKYNALIYGIRPFFGILNQDELDYLAELSDSEVVSVNQFTNEIGLLVNGAIADPNRSHDKQLDIVIGHMKKFTNKWLVKNWEWAAGEVLDALHAKPMPITVTNEETEIFAEEDSLVDEVLRSDNQFSTWKVYYAPKRSVDDVHLIPGESIEDVEDSLAAYIGENKISCSIKPGSVARTLNWILNAPKEVEQIRMRKDVHGTVFKKVKRGDVRIFYQADTVSKEMVFFLHQKKDWDYGF